MSRTLCKCRDVELVEDDDTSDLLGTGQHSSDEEITDTGSLTVGQNSERLRCFVYAVVAVAVQALMSWDGGATQGSMNSLEKVGWRTWEQGLVVSLDRFPGVVISASLWGYILKTQPTKPWLLLAILCKACSSGCFGILDSTSWQGKIYMMIARFFMGFWESLFTVWVYVWVVRNAGGSARAANWSNGLGIAAGAGSNTGMLLASWGSQLGLGYSFAYKLQATLLFCVFVAVLCLPAMAVDILPDTADAERQGEPETRVRADSMATLAEVAENLQRVSHHLPEQREASEFIKKYSQLNRHMSRRLSDPEKVKGPLSSRTFVFMTVAWSFGYFIQSGINALWQNTAVNVWNFTTGEASLVLVLCCTVGGTLGMGRGKQQIEAWFKSEATLARAGVYEHLPLADPVRRVIVLTVLTRVCGLISLVCTLAGLLMGLKIQRIMQVCLPQPLWGWLLASLIICMGVLQYLLGACLGIMQVEALAVLSESQQSAATSHMVVFQNLLGYGLGADLPAAAASFWGFCLTRWWYRMEKQAARGCQYAFGISIVFAAGWAMRFALGCGALRECRCFEFDPCRANRPKVVRKDLC